MSTIRTFGASSRSRRGWTRFWYDDSCIVRPARLADGVGGNGSTSWVGSPLRPTVLPDTLSVSLATIYLSYRAVAREALDERMAKISLVSRSQTDSRSTPHRWPVMSLPSQGGCGRKKVT
jgi:hypothetical protein